MDKTLYRPVDVLDKLVLNEIVKLISRKTGEPNDAVIPYYVGFYRKLNSHTGCLKALKLPVGFARDAHNMVPFADFIEPDMQLQDMIGRLKERGLLCSVYSNNTKRNVADVLRKLGVLSQLEFTLDGDVFPKGVEDGYEKAVRLANICAQSHEQPDFAPNKTVYVGDRESVDIVPARKAGMRTVLVNWSGQTVESSADAVISDIYSLETVIDSWL